MIRVLIVEDDPMIADINKTYIESTNEFEVIAKAGNGRDALKFMMNRNDIDLVIIDIYLPEMNGIALIKEMRRKNINHDVIFITASKNFEDIDTAMKYGAVDYLIKPFTFERFSKTMSKYLEKRSAMENLKGSKDITQGYVDSLMSGKQQSSISLPKGLEMKTFGKIHNFLKTTELQEFTLLEATDILELTTVTLRKYLKHMEKLGYVKLRKEYGEVGRPKVVYFNCLME